MNKADVHWLKAWRREAGLSREALAARVRTKGYGAIGCSERLIEILEDEKGVTHPKIADRIAKVTDATLAQRNSIVAKKHRITSQRVDKPRGMPPNARAVVCINPGGQEMARYPSVTAAALASGVSPSAVMRRCKLRLRAEREFTRYGCTWRYVDEWEAPR